MRHERHFSTQLLKPELTPEMFDTLPPAIQEHVSVGDKVLSYLLRSREGGVQVKVVAERNLHELDELRYVELAGVIPVFEVE